MCTQPQALLGPKHWKPKKRSPHALTCMFVPLLASISSAMAYTACPISSRSCRRCRCTSSSVSRSTLNAVTSTSTAFSLGANSSPARVRQPQG
ncbi:hypothetical protein DUNSADRAFT_11183 [Dunaliella salina]|uniref:Encoded protein n=1 Tax=Dunaliella salina TaxID=3046 RepID=A0ABQ7GDY3_DUNSA|nr:hypothetical protein DUNSADRAFT_11183 [Dunaliella salina]|eukprot:KAF5832810.1 hypothetical protein DUNSADRAFT_11183 [Dunaliella salina]